MRAVDYYTKHLGRAVVFSLLLLSCPTLRSQAAPAKSTSAEAPPASPADTIGRGTPRGTVLGLLSAARKGNTGLAADIEIFAYMFASDWNKFLEIQEELLYGIMDMVEKVGTTIAFPTQTLYLESDKQAQVASKLRQTKPRRSA